MKKKIETGIGWVLTFLAIVFMVRITIEAVIEVGKSIAGQP